MHHHPEDHDHSEHVHDEHCTCGHEHHEARPLEGLSYLQQNLLLALYERRYLPVACFSLTNKSNAHDYAVALAPVYLASAGDSMETVKALALSLEQLEQGGLITLDYDMRLSGYAYAEYESSELYAYFKRTVEEGKEIENARYDTATLELGSMALTEEGISAVQKMTGQSV